MDTKIQNFPLVYYRLVWTTIPVYVLPYCFLGGPCVVIRSKNGRPKAKCPLCLLAGWVQITAVVFSRITPSHVIGYICGKHGSAEFAPGTQNSLNVTVSLAPPLPVQIYVTGTYYMYGFMDAELAAISERTCGVCYWESIAFHTLLLKRKRVQ